MTREPSGQEPPEGEPDAPPAATVLVPAFDEVETVARVVRAALASRLGPVLVIDDGSTDGTHLAAAAAGAEVLRLERNEGKGGAVAAGARAAATDVVLLVDADLTGLAAGHLHALAAPLLAGEVDMTRGVFVGGRWRTSAAQRLAPQLNGQRALRREGLLEVPGLAESRYGIEIAITEHAARSGWRCRDVPLLGVSQVMKEEKRGFWPGLALRLRMYRDIVGALLRNLARWPERRRGRDRRGTVRGGRRRGER